MAIIAPRYLIKNLMRILTPEEIDLLTTIDSGKKKSSLTKILLNKINGIDEVYEKGSLVLEEPEESQEKKKKDGDLTKESSQKKSNSIVKEIDKIKKSYNKVKQKEMLDFYQKNSQVDINKDGKEKDLKKSSHEGILINKKQF